MGDLEVNGDRLEIAEWGPPDGPCLVLLHEGLGSVGLWRDFPGKLASATGWRVFAYSRAGYGRSSNVSLPRPLDHMSRESAVITAIFDHLDGNDFVLLGHSDGATIAAIYAGSVSDRRVRGLILMAPHFFAEADGLKAIETAREAYENGDMRDRLARHHDFPDSAFYGWNDTWLAPDFKGWNVADCIDHWRVPVLAIQGRNDEYGTLAQIEEIESRIYAPLEALVLDDCGHAPHLEKQPETLRAISDFCARLARIEKATVHLA
ncbi:MAG: alpha/beta hydrolase [Pseudomonadota bacterium]